MGGLGSGRGSGLGRETVEDCGSIDVNRLHKAGCLRPGRSVDGNGHATGRRSPRSLCPTQPPSSARRRAVSAVCPRAILRLDPVPKAHKCPHENTRVGGRPRLSEPIRGGGPNASVGTPSTLGKDGGGIFGLREGAGSSRSVMMATR